MRAVDDSLEIGAAELNREVDAYRTARVARLTADNGWLTIIDKVWLSQGVHRIGSAPGSEIALPADSAPAVVGRVTVEGSAVRLDAAPGVTVLARGQPIGSLVLRADTDENPDQIAIGSLSLELLRRDSDVAVRVRDADSPLRRSFAGIPYFATDPAWRIVAELHPVLPEKQVIYEDSEGRPQVYLSPGIAAFEKNGIACRLEPVFDNDRKRLFVLFTDATNPEDTYGAGRFLYAPLPERDRVVLDFNKAFNPPCAFTPYAACPLPRAQNRLPIRVEAGEKLPLAARA